VLWERSVTEQRYNAVLEVLEAGLPAPEVADRYGVSRQSVIPGSTTTGLVGWRGSPTAPIGPTVAPTSSPQRSAAARRCAGVSGRPVHPGPCPGCWTLATTALQLAGGRVLAAGGGWEGASGRPLRGWAEGRSSRAMPASPRRRPAGGASTST
jgi:hypothetical protein